jgi:hypothetical protein
MSDRRGTVSMHIRWHVKRGVKKEGCELCFPNEIPQEKKMKHKKTEEKWMVMYLPEPLTAYDLDNQTVTPLAAPGPAPMLIFDVDADTKRVEKQYLEGALYQSKLRTLARTVGRESGEAISRLDPTEAGAVAANILSNARYSGGPFPLREAMTIAVHEDNAVGVMLTTYPFTIIDLERCHHEFFASGEAGIDRHSAAAFRRCLERGVIPGLLLEAEGCRKNWVAMTLTGFVAWAAKERDRDWQHISVQEMGGLLGKGRHEKFYNEKLHVDGNRTGRASLQFAQAQVKSGDHKRYWLIPRLAEARQQWNARMGAKVAWGNDGREWRTVEDIGWRNGLVPSTKPKEFIQPF